MYFGQILLKTLLDFCTVKIQDSYLLLSSSFCELIMYIILVMYRQLQNHITVCPYSLRAWSYGRHGGIIIHRRQLVCLHVQMLQSILWMGLAGQNVKVGQVVVNLTAVAVR